MQYSRAPLDERRAQLQARAKQFEKWNEFSTEALQLLVPVLREAGQNAEADKLQTDLIRKNRRNRFDLGIDIGAESLLEKLDAEQWESAHQEFRKIIRRFGEKGGGTLFYNLIEPYIITLREAGQEKLAADSLEYVEKNMPFERGSQLYNYFEELRGNNGARKKSR